MIILTGMPEWGLLWGLDIAFNTCIMTSTHLLRTLTCKQAVFFWLMIMLPRYALCFVYFPVYFFLHWYHVSQVCDTSVWKEVAVVKKITADDEMDPSELAFVDPGSNVYSFGLLMLEIISGKLPNFEEQGSLLNLVRLGHNS